ncbi:protein CHLORORESPIRATORY REDUCTION 42, chloroplastic [Euphorbia lathyris]|uniref:protein CHLORORESPIRATORY REDUCTION 42, chloroplastic n=1 Tax=Euphorbia lathyris TaxID=212925 RepID=UPI0033140B8C
MALSFVSSARVDNLSMQQFRYGNRRLNLVSERCSSDENKNKKLGIGSAIVVTEAPKMIKTAASVPCLRLNSGLVKPGDVGRIVSRKPKDVWAVRLTIGTYLIDAKYFKPLDLLNQ